MAKFGRYVQLPVSMSYYRTYTSLSYLKTEVEDIMNSKSRLVRGYSRSLKVALFDRSHTIISSVCEIGDYWSGNSNFNLLEAYLTTHYPPQPYLASLLWVIIGILAQFRYPNETRRMAISHGSSSSPREAFN